MCTGVCAGVAALPRHEASTCDTAELRCFTVVTNEFHALKYRGRSGRYSCQARMWAEGVGDRILRRRAWMIEQRATIQAALGAGLRA